MSYVDYFLAAYFWKNAQLIKPYSLESHLNFLLRDRNWVFPHRS